MLKNLVQQMRPPLFPFISGLMVLTGTLSPALALTGQVGVVRSQDNAQQWTSITNRLRATGVDYCIVEANLWQALDDLGNTRVLILPNVANLSGAQAIALDEWMERGGRVIVTGPTGSLSQPEVRTQLRGLFGAYWGFTNSTPSTLKITDVAPTSGTNPSLLSSTLIGGVIIPTNLNSQTVAVWLSDGTPPAVVTTDRATFLGWRWGVDAVASATLDTAWLQTALQRYGIRSLQGIQSPNPSNCKNSSIAQENSPNIPLLPPTSPPISPVFVPVTPPALPSSTITTPQPLTFTPVPSNPSNLTNPSHSRNNNNGISSQQVQDMNTELAQLIARFESTFIAAEAVQQGINGSTRQLAEQSLKNPAQDPQKISHPSYQTLTAAKEGLRQFNQLIQQQDYAQARETWLQTRRSLWDHYPTDRVFAQPEIRAMWLDRGTIVKARSEADLAKVFDQMAQAGINTVFFETVNASYPIYPSRVAPEQNPLTQGWDPLKAAIKLAHERGMELHAWVWVFAAANQGHNRVLGQPTTYLGPVLSRHPDWAITDKNGNPFDRGTQFKKAFLDPANPEVKRYLLALLTEIATNYEVDGIQLDYIRYPFQDPQLVQTFGYSKSSRFLFKEMTGVDPIEISPSHPLWSRWTGFRVQQVDSFVATASAHLKQLRPELILSTAVFPMERRERVFRLQQNWEEWVDRKWVDMVVLMTYALDTGSLEERTQPLLNPSLADSALVIPGLRLLKVPDSVTMDQLQLIRNLPTEGFALFAAENLTPSLQTLLSRTQNNRKDPTNEPLPYRAPFKAVSARYRALQQEWSFLLTHNQLTMTQGNLQDWAKQVDTLATVLDELAENPSEQQLNLAKRNLEEFRRQFKGWMRQHQENHPYQVQIWENRLTSLDKLLVYGQWKVLEEK